MPYAVTVDHPGGTSRFDVTHDALVMVATLGGHLHAYLGGEGCRAQSLAFTTREPRRTLEGRVDVPEAVDEVDARLLRLARGLGWFGGFGHGGGIVGGTGVKGRWADRR